MAARKYKPTWHLHCISSENGVALERVTVAEYRHFFSRDLLMLLDIASKYESSSLLKCQLIKVEGMVDEII